jgi:hypothetical protein
MKEEHRWFDVVEHRCDDMKESYTENYGLSLDRFQDDNMVISNLYGTEHFCGLDLKTLLGDDK